MFGTTGFMKTQPGKRDEVIAILLDGVEDLKDAGCHAYIVCEGNEDEIVVMEVWDSQQHHRDSLNLPHVKDQIARAMPMLTGEFGGQELVVRGGLGVSD